MINHEDHILLIQPLVGIGDMLWHKPWIDQLRKTNQITLLTKPTTRSRYIFEETSNFKIIDLERSMRGKFSKHDGFFGFLRLVKLFSNINPDLAMILHQSSRYAAASRVAGIRKIYGYGFGVQKLFVNSGKILPKNTKKVHAIERIKIFSNLNSFGLSNPNWSINVKENKKIYALKFLQTNNLVKNEKPIPFISIGVGAMNEERQWGGANFAKLIKLILNKRKDFKIMLICGSGDKNIIKEIKSNIPHDIKLPIADGKLDKVIAIMSFSKGYIGNDTSFLNIMACLKKPSLGLFSLSKPLNYNKYFFKIDRFKDKDFGKPGLIKKITPLEVFNKFQNIWEKQ